LDRLNEIIETLRASRTTEQARDNLMKNFGLSQVQAQAILEMQLRRLAGLERQRIIDEYTEIIKTIASLEDLLANPKKIDYTIKDEAADLKKKYGDPRRTEIYGEEVTAFGVEDLIPHQTMVVTLSRKGYIKRTPADTYHTQHRGGKGVMGMTTREADAVQHLAVADTHDSLLFFTNRGKVYHLKGHELPLDSSRTARGVPLSNLVSMDEKETITAVVAVAEFKESEFLVMATRLGEVKRTVLKEFAAVRSNGLVAMDLAKADELIGACLSTKEDDMILVSTQGKALRFKVGPLRTASRASGGVRGIRLVPGDKVVSMDIVRPEDHLLTITAGGFGKRTPLKSYPSQGRGGGGVMTFRITPKSGKLIAARVVSKEDDLMFISTEGQVTRQKVQGIPSHGRNTQGVGVMKMDPGDSVAAVACCVID
ncbi:MAG: DNA gyrase C-terminal beta-propeller domain-containing protein, partial [Chloroflexota bacterium]|nr:DNA gyrase C-terminal beta-propeller domain-containing protein [Chloroflexota bacterium]